MTIEVPESRAGQFLFFAVMDAISFAIVCASTRAVAIGSYRWTAIADFVFGFQAFALFKLAVDDPKARTWAAGLGAACGGAFGSCVALWISKHFGG